jgi:hypothetical protein
MKLEGMMAESHHKNSPSVEEVNEGQVPVFFLGFLFPLIDLVDSKLKAI